MTKRSPSLVIALVACLVSGVAACGWMTGRTTASTLYAGDEMLLDGTLDQLLAYQRERSWWPPFSESMKHRLLERVDYVLEPRGATGDGSASFTARAFARSEEADPGDGWYRLLPTDQGVRPTTRAQFEAGLCDGLGTLSRSYFSRQRVLSGDEVIPTGPN